jgi:hypothetical protein
MRTLVERTQALIDNPKFRVTDTVASLLLARIAELEKEKKILYIEAQIEGVELVADWIDGYYAPCVVAVVDELWKELNKLEQGK